MRTEPISERFGTQIIGSSPKELASLDDAFIVEFFKERGALLFRDFGVTREEFDAFAGRFSKEYMSYRGGGYIRKEVNGGKDKTLLSVNYDYGREKQDTFGLPLHGEMYYTDRRPVMLWFYCQQPPTADGETIICDGSEILEHLEPEHRRLIQEQPLKYLRRYRREEWEKIYQTDDIDDAAAFAREGGLTVTVDREDEILRTEYIYPAVITSRWGGHRVYINNMLTVLWQERVLGLDKSIVRFEDGSEIPDDFVQDVRGVQQKLLQRITWGKGDFIMIDNTRVLHGRRAFSDPNRELYLRMVRDVTF